MAEGGRPDKAESPSGSGSRYYLHRLSVLLDWEEGEGGEGDYRDYGNETYDREFSLYIK
jgi:hypothetical protein